MIAVEISQRKVLSDGFINTDARYNHPTFPRPSFLTTLTQPERFKDYIAGKFPEAVNNKLSISLMTGTNHEPLHKEVNATIVNTLLNSAIPTNVANLDWMQNAVFPDNVLPMDFNDHCLNNVQECWDESLQKFSHFPENVTEHAVQDWLNHLAHTMGVKHDLIQKIPEDLTTDAKVASDAGTGINEGAKIGGDIDISSELDKELLDNGVEEEGFVVPKAEDRAFSMVSYRKAPSGGYRLCKPDIVLVNRNLRHFLEEGNCRP